MERAHEMYSELKHLVCRPQFQLRSANRAPLFALIVLGLFARFAPAQSYSTNAGLPSFATPEPVEFGFVDTASGDLHLNIPLGSYPQRGSSQPHPITLEYDSNIWGINTFSGAASWVPKNAIGSFNQGGWAPSFLLEANTLPGSQYQNCTQDLPWMDLNGTSHTFHVATAPYSNCPAEADAFATDSSGYHLYFWNNGNFKIYAPDGTLEAFYPYVQESNGNWLVSEDRNGNYLSQPQFEVSEADDLGRQIASYGGNTITLATSQGTANYQLAWTTIYVKTQFNWSGVSEYNNGIGISVLRSLTLPDTAQSTYYFTYDCDETNGNNPTGVCTSPGGRSGYYGVLTGMTLPTGGTVSYTYQMFKDSYGNNLNWVSTRTSSGGTWTYSPQVLSTCGSSDVNCKQQTTVQEPDGTTIYTYQLNNGAWPTQIVRKDMSGNVVSTITNTWDLSQPCVTINCHGNAYIRLLNQQTTVPGSSGNLTKQVSYTYDSPQYGNRSAIKEWGYVPSGNAFPSVPDRATYSTFLYYTGANNLNYTGQNIVNIPLSVTLCSATGSDSACPGGGSRVSQTQYTYDAYGTNGITGITGIAQHDDGRFGTTNTSRGNVTSISRWVSGTNYLTTSSTYDTTGQVLSQTDPAGNITRYSYSDTNHFFVDQGSNGSLTRYTPTQPTNAYVTSVSDSIGTQYTDYYWGSGKAADSTDYNGVVTYYHYRDGLDRKTEEDDPIGWSLASYPSPSESDAYTAVADTAPSTGCTSCRHTQINLDQWGRKASQILVNNPFGPVEVDTNYNAVNEIQSETHPYSGTSDPNRVFESYVFDALGRPLSNIHTDNQIARTAYGTNVTSIGGLATQGGSTATYGYGYPQITMDEAGKQRQQWTDGFGNLIEVDEPSAITSTQGTGQISLYEGQTQEECFPTGCTWLTDSGSVSVTVFGTTFSASYDQYDSGASTIAGEMNASGLVVANLSGDSISVTAVVPGANSQITGSCQSDYSQYFNCLSPSVSGISGGSGGISSSPFVTNYTYDAGGRVTKVVQGAQTRTFSYDGLGRLTSASNPESGTITYSYTSGGVVCSGDSSNVCQRTDARGVVSTYTYDHANRLTGVAYTIPGGKNIASMPNVCTTSPNNTSANVCKYYDQGGAAAYALGRLTKITDPIGSETYSHDADGRTTQFSKVVGSNTYNIGYQYYAGGDVKQITYPSGRVVQQVYNNVGQLCQIAPTATGCTGSSYYALIPVSGIRTSNGYDDAGHLINLTYGNGVTATYTYSPTRNQLTSLSYFKGSSTYFGLQYSYQQSSPYSPNCSSGTTGDNGSIECITDNVNSARTSSFGYDSLNRLIFASNSSWGLSETYDRYGNRWSQTITSGSGPSSSLTFGNNGLNGSTNNQPNGYTFDASGNVTVEPTVPQQTYLTYDGESRITGVSGSSAATYTYDGNGVRVVRSVAGGTTTVSIHSGNPVIAEYDNGAAPGAPSREYIYNSEGDVAAGLLAMISNSVTTYYHQDNLSVRVTTDASGNPVTQEGHFPFGEPWYQSGPTNKWFFTGKERDSESGSDYSEYRYYASTTGRWLGPDPSGSSYSDTHDPQSLNLYTYVGNHVLQYIDPYGLNWFNQAPCSGTYYAQNSLGSEIRSFFSHLFANCGGGGGGGGGDSNPWPDQPGQQIGRPTSNRLSQKELDIRYGLIRVNLTSTPCGAKFSAAAKSHGLPFSPDLFINNLKANLTQAPSQTEPGNEGSLADTNPRTWKIRLLKPFYGLSPVDQAGTMEHEGTHGYFHIGDNNGNSFLNFRNYGFEGFKGSDNEGTHDFTLWLENGCPNEH